MTPNVRHTTDEPVQPRAEPNAYGRWVSTKALGARLDAPYFDPAFDEIEALIAARPGEVVQLSDIILKVVHRRDRDKSSQLTAGNDLPFIAATSISSHAMLDTDRSTIQANQRDKSGACVDTEGIVVNTIASRYQFAYYSPTLHGAPIALSPHLALLITRNGIEPAFLASELCHSYITLQIARLVRRAFIPKLTVSDLLSVRVVLPPAPDQSRVANDVRVRSSIFVSGSAAAGVGAGRVGATFDEVIDNIEGTILDIDWVDLKRSKFIEWDLTARFETSGRIWGLPRSTGGVQCEGIELSTDLREWVSQGEESFGIFNSMKVLEILDYQMLSTLDLSEAYTRAQLSALLDFLEKYQGSSVDIDVDFVRSAVHDHAGLARTFANPDDAVDALTAVIRPFLLLSVSRYGQPYGAFLLGGPEQFTDPEGAYERIRTAGVALSAQIKSQLALLPEIESLAANRTVTELMHRIKNPLGDIDNAIGFLEMWASRHQLVDDLVPDEEQAALDASECGQELAEFTVRGYLDRIRSAKRELSNLARKLRNLARAETGGNPEWHQLTTIIDAALNKTTGNRRSIACEVHRQREVEVLFDVYGDEGLLIDAFVNVIENALREMTVRPPVLEISVFEDRDKCLIEILDNGLDEGEDLIDDPFGWGATKHFTTGKGSGYGLPMVRKTFNFLNCHCDLEKLVGRPGSRFWGTLPTRKATER